MKRSLEQREYNFVIQLPIHETYEADTLLTLLRDGSLGIAEGLDKLLGNTKLQERETRERVVSSLSDHKKFLSQPPMNVDPEMFNYIDAGDMISDPLSLARFAASLLVKVDPLYVPHTSELPEGNPNKWTLEQKDTYTTFVGLNKIVGFAYQAFDEPDPVPTRIGQKIRINEGNFLT